jgi:energy-coupling factor transporter ATP-binding protein EcfA2
VSIADDILAWVQDRPAWQRDALRRLLAARSLTTQDVEELVELCMGVPGAVPCPVGPEDFQDEAGDHVTVELVEVAEVRHVNAINSDAPLRIATHGISVVYGPNGAGKSGYVRLLKQLCHARSGAPTILPNIYRDRPVEPAAARIRYRVGGTESAFQWQEGAAGPEPLRRISVFDHDCASIFTDESCTVAYLPFGLDLLPRLAEACTEVRRHLEAERDRLNRVGMAPVSVPPGTEAARILSSLGTNDARSAVERFAVFDADDDLRFRELDRLLNEQSPARRAAELEGQARRVDEFMNRLLSITNAVADRSVAALRNALQEQRCADEALRVASEEAFASEPLAGTGGNAWRELWEAARRFAVGIETGVRFPPSEGEECVLCQQPLSSDGAMRMRRFEEFVGSVLDSRARAADENVRSLRQAVEGAGTVRHEDLQPDLELAHSELFEAVRGLISRVDVRRGKMAGAESEECLRDLPMLQWDDIVDRLQQIRDSLGAEAAELRTIASQDGRDALAREHAELAGRSRLAERRDDLLREVSRHERIRVIDTARATTVTTGITRRNSELTEQYFTQTLARTFDDTLRELRLDSLPIHVAGAAGERGTAHHRLTLGADTYYAVRPGQVLSEGEHRCVALAAFLAESIVQPGASTVILDDPVSSLDHDRRDVVARRLVGVGTFRPVLVFTHDLAFALALQRYADAAGVHMQLSRLVPESGAVGRVADNLPWPGMNVKRRVGHLRQLCQQAEAARAHGGTDEYERRAKEIYGFLREAWERAVEEVLLNGAIQRFAPEVQTLRLRRLGAVSHAHMTVLEGAMSKCSRWLRGHDDPAPVDDPIPEPHEVLSDIEALDAWRKAVQELHQS